VNRTQDDNLVSRGPVPIRRAHLADREAIRTFFAGLSARTRYLRFFAALTITPAMLRVLSGGDNADAVVATGQGAIIGHGIAADRVGPGGTAITEIGVVVADTWHGHGVGSALVRALISAAEARGVAIVAMEVLPGNQRVLAMIASHWPAASINRSADCVIIRAQLPQRRQGGREGHPPGFGRPSASMTAMRSRSSRTAFDMTSAAALGERPSASVSALSIAQENSTASAGGFAILSCTAGSSSVIEDETACSAVAS
jgi:GNAT superfamily N-acetyltransferase